jgi:hypothetical protein
MGRMISGLELGPPAQKKKKKTASHCPNPHDDPTRLVNPKPYKTRRRFAPATLTIIKPDIVMGTENAGIHNKGCRVL